MTKTLLKKQMMDSFSWIYFNRKNGKRRDVKGILLYTLIYLALFGMLGYMFFEMSTFLCEPLSKANLGWLYFALVSLIGIVLGVFGSVFNTFASLYQAKDNDLLLSMPIPTSKILIMRLSGVYAMGLMYELIVMIPAIIVWICFGNPTTVGILFSILLPFILSVFVLTLSCILGWVVALVSSKFKNKSFVTVFLSLAFIAIYYYVYFQAYEMLSNILMYAQNIADSVKSILYPFYHLGLAAEGKPLSLLIFTGIVAVFFAVVYLVMKQSFVKFATTNKGARKVKTKKIEFTSGSIHSALFKKELKHFTSNATYMMNCGLGIIFMIIAAVLLFIKGGILADVLPQIYPGAEEIVPLLLLAAIFAIISMNDISAPSVSLEGKSIWVTQVLPINAWQALKAKLELHFALTFPPAALLTISILVTFKPSIGFMILIPIIVVLYTSMMDMFGLFLNLKSPNLKWTNEVVPIKQSMSVTIALFGGWVLTFGLGFCYYLLYDIVTPIVFLILLTILLIALNIMLFVWIKNKGSNIFKNL